MNCRNYLWIGIGAAFALAVAFCVLAPTAKAINDPPTTGNPVAVAGDWIVTDERVYNLTTIYIDSGNLTVQAGGNLSINTVRLVFNNFEDGNYSIKVEAGGILNVDNRCTITSNRSTIHYGFVIQGTAFINLSTVCEMWGDNSSWAGGIQVYSDSVTITNDTIYNGKTGGISVFSASPIIDRNSIYANGQDGGSPNYCFGIYAYNSNSNISNNQIYDNTLFIIDSLLPNSYISYSPAAPPPNNAYYQLWNGNYYNGYGYGGYGNFYRYQYSYMYPKSKFYGTGVYIEGSANTTLYGNTIQRNGYHAVGQTSVNTPNVDEGFGTGTAMYYQYSGYGPHRCTFYNYTYYYYNFLYGQGIYIKDSTVSLVSNTLDKNGFETNQGGYYTYEQSNRGFYYSGVALTMANSKGNLSANNIRNSAILVNLMGSSPTIDGNQIIGDYITGGSYSSQMIPWRTGYGIRCDPYSLPVITNNTITFTYRDNNNNIMSVGGINTPNMDSVVAVELPQTVKNQVIQGNKISFTSSSGGGYTTAYGINISYKATGVQLINNIFSYSFTGTNNGRMPQYLVQISLISDTIVNNCTFNGPGVTGNMPTTYGVTCTYGSTLTISNSIFNGVHYGVMATDYSKMTMTSCKMTNIVTSGVWLEQFCSGTVSGANIAGNSRSFSAIRSKLTISDSTLASFTEFYVDKGSSIEVYNTVHTPNAVMMMDADSFVNVSWSFKMSVFWQNEEPVPIENASVLIKTLTGGPVFSGMTGPDGRAAPMLWIKEYQAHDQVITRYTPHRVSASKGRATAMDLYMVNQPIDATFWLVDNVPPELIIDTPADNQHFNYSMVTISGKSSDIESGLLNDQVNINIDNTGWTPLAVTDGAWSLQMRLTDGLHIIRLVAEDLVGNTARSTISISVDTTAPVLQVFSPIEGSSTSQRTIPVTGLSEDDAFVTVNGITVPVSKRYFSAMVSLEDGNNTITVAASDISGNAKTVVVHVILDTLAPILAITTPVEGTYTNQNPISLEGNTEPTAIIKVNGFLAEVNGTRFEALVSLSEGTNLIEVRAADQAGNIKVERTTIYLDTAIPDLTVYTPRDELWTNQSKVLITGATEQGASMTINGQNVNVQNTLFSFSINLMEGANKIDFVAKDAAGNTKSLSRTVYLDTKPPELVVTSPMDRIHISTRVVPVLGSVDWGSEVRVNGERMTVTDFVFSTSLNFDSDGTKVMDITAVDQAGNTAAATRTVFIDTIPPTISISFPIDNTKIPHRMITVSGQTEPGATIVVNTETIVKVGTDGLFSVPVVLEDGENRITVKAMDESGNSDTSSVTVTKPIKAAEVKEDMSWALNLTGVLIGIGIALPIATFLITDSRRRSRAKLMAEIEAAEQERKEREAMEARRAAMPTVERIGKKRVAKAPAPPKEEPPHEPPKMSMPPTPEAPAIPEVAKAGLKDKSGAEEVSAEDTEQASKMEAPKAPSAVEAPEAPQPPSDPTLKDKGTEAEGAAEETEVQEDVKKKK